MDLSDSELIAATLGGDPASFEPLIQRYQGRVFATARKYARRESEVEDIVQEVFLKAYSKLSSFRGESPFEHWLMKLTVRTCYDFLRQHQRSREKTMADVSEEESLWLEQAPRVETGDPEAVAAAREVLHKIMEELTPQSRMIIQLLEIEEKSLKEISDLTGWSISMIKVRAFRARTAMKKALDKIQKDRYL